MKKNFLAALLAAVAFAGAVVGQDAASPFNVTPGFRVSTNPAQAAPAAEKRDPLWFACHVAVKINERSGAAGSGTPVAVEGGKTLVLTNAHVVPRHYANLPITVTAAGKTYPARYVDGAVVRPTKPGFIEVEGTDLCILEIDADIGGVKIADADPAVGSDVWQYGYGGTQPGDRPTTKSGVVVANDYNQPTLTSTLSSVSGDSGSGVFNAAGELVGVTWGGGDGTHHGVPVREVKKFLGGSLLRKLFPGLMGRVDERRADRAEAKEAREGAKAEAGRATKAEPANKPAGEGWQWDPAKKLWWRNGIVNPIPKASPGVFNIDPNCPTGQCPLKAPSPKK